ADSLPAPPRLLRRIIGGAFRSGSGARRCRRRQGFHVEAVVVPSPLAAVQDRLRDLLQGQVLEGVALPPERRAADEQGSLAPYLIADELELVPAESLRRDVEVVGLRGSAVDPEDVRVGFVA